MVLSTQQHPELASKFLPTSYNVEVSIVAVCLCPQGCVAYAGKAMMVVWQLGGRVVMVFIYYASVSWLDELRLQNVSGISGVLGREKRVLCLEILFSYTKRRLALCEQLWHCSFIFVMVFFAFSWQRSLDLKIKTKFIAMSNRG